MSKRMSIRAAVIAAAITAIGSLGLLALSLSAGLNLLAWSSKPWFLPVTISLSAFSVLIVLMASKRQHKPNPSSKRTREKPRAA